MYDLEEFDTLEREFRRRWHRAHIERFDSEHDSDEQSWRERRITPHAHEATPFLETLRRSRDLSAFQSATDRWVRSFESGYSGTAGQMVINQINKMAPDPDAAVEVLLDSLSTPTDLDDAVRKVRRLEDYLRSIQVGSHPGPKRAPFVVSYFWALDDPETWPVAWPKSLAYLEYCTGVSQFDHEGNRYAALYEFATRKDGDPIRFEQIAAWWSDQRPIVIDEVLCERAALRERADKQNEDPSQYMRNAQALVAVAHHIGHSLEQQVSEAVGRTLKAQKPSPWWSREWPRGDLWVDWKVPSSYGLGVRLWLNSQGIAIGLRPYLDADSGATERAIETIETRPIKDYRILAGGSSKRGDDVGFMGGGTGEVVYARWFGRDIFTDLNIKQEALTAAQDVAPLIASLSGDPYEADLQDDMAALVSEFKELTGYPTPGHEQDNADRRDFAKLLDPEELAFSDRGSLPRIWSSGRYGSTGPMSALNKSLRDADEQEYRRIIETLSYICWGEDPAAVRIDKALDDPALRVRGLGESVMMKLLAITHPEQFITIYPYNGPKGKLKMLKLLGIASPNSNSPGENQVKSNDALRNRLDRFFPSDPLGVGVFLYWLAERDQQPETEPARDGDPFDQLAEELLVERSFIDDIAALLEDKKQVVFYGPPGTGKTYFARKLAEALVPNAERRPVVQFHPSTSYEDFFEGYRPDVDADGNMSYRLQQGPLAQLAARAHESPGRRHLMIIDEINRANLPRVLGELLFLFEYRDTPVRTLYRPDEPFELSKDIWFIGTMNTADRSIALIDAALRRRFHFIPFFPNQGPMSGLLDRWLAREGEPAWVGELVAQVNHELTVELGGPHLQLGPSHFMKKDLDQQKVRRIWEYDVEPFVEDQFFGDPERIAQFRFQQVWERFSELAPESLEEETNHTEGSD